jgi:hypothetical protein
VRSKRKLKDAVLYVRCTPAQLEAVKKAASARGWSDAQMVREAIRVFIEALDNR